MKAVLWIAIAVAGLTAGALVELFAPECDQPICLGGASPGLVIILAGILAPLTVSEGVLAVGLGVVAGALTGLSVSLGAGAAMMFSGSPGTAGPTSISPIVLTMFFGGILGFVGAAGGTTVRLLLRRLRHVRQ
jgi:hypothetical protein